MSVVKGPNTMPRFTKKEQNDGMIKKMGKECNLRDKMLMNSLGYGANQMRKTSRRRKGLPQGVMVPSRPNDEGNILR